METKTLALIGGIVLAGIAGYAIYSSNVQLARLMEKNVVYNDNRSIHFHMHNYVNGIATEDVSYSTVS